MNSVKHKVRDQLCNQTWDRVGIQVWDRVLDQGWELTVQVRNQICPQALVPVQDQVRDETK
jgi:hypothetical protein